MNDQIKVDFGQLSGAAGDISGHATKVQTELDELKQRLAPVIAQWEGSSSETYQEAQRKWDTAAADLQQVLASIGTAVAAATEAYQSAEQRNTGRWG
ncbi:WXG100 family type VII secretion target [Actinosynnema pretiosum]|uniref:ESAT-6-like protein n=1 Tax=Actinosynnema pretiosum TaxID=42197 RepID=A0A290ZEK4_9PSEU|nr:WXG100 family type VII secretion target [Actinosynnema pretiosum]ATE57399.1 WXG100 family type VII secretion target [Actinosynnema pretiosum]